MEQLDITEAEVQAKMAASEAALQKPRAYGFKALGHEGRTNYIWSNHRQSIEAISANDITNPGLLMSLLGTTWLELNHSKTHKDGVAIDFKAVGGVIADKCSEKGPFRPGSIRGAGVWQSDDDINTLVINSQSGVFRTDSLPIDRIGTNFIYKVSRNIGLTIDTEKASVEVNQTLLAAIKTWNFKRSSDAHLVLGWLCQAFVAGGLNWRTHASLTGPAGSGKSFLLQFLSTILDESCLLADGSSSAAGIRQAMGNDAIAYLSDESEPDGEKLKNTMEFFRTASSSNAILRGTQNGTGQTFTASFVGMLAGICRPAMNAADTSRFLMLDLLKLEADKKMNVLVANNPEAKALVSKMGLQLFSRIVSDWARFTATVEMIKRVMRKSGDTNRFADTIGGVIGAAFFALHDEVLTDTRAADWISKFELSESRESVEDSDDAGEILERILASSVPLKNNHFTLGQLAQKACNSCADDHVAAVNVLAQYGLRADRIAGSTCLSMTVYTKSPQLEELMRNSRFANSNLKSMLLRMPGAEKIKSVRIAGQTKSNTVKIPTDLQVCKDLTWQDEEPASEAVAA